jgi:hypothetical protein
MQTIIQIIRAAFQSGKLAFALVGPKGSLKSAVAREAPDSMERKLNYSLSILLIRHVVIYSWQGVPATNGLATTILANEGSSERNLGYFGQDWCTWWSRGSWICQMGIETQHSQKYNGLRRQFLRCITGFRLIHILALNLKRFHQLFIQPWTRPDGHTENSTTSLPDRRCDWSRRCWLIGGEGHSCLITSEDWIGMP